MTNFSEMKNFIITGGQWGDEGKGKFSDILAQKSHAVVRFNGGNNAGHTIKQGGVTYHVHGLPSGVFPKTQTDSKVFTRNYIANGCVVDAAGILKEIAYLGGQGVLVNPKNLMIDAGAPLVLQAHKDLDGAFEAHRTGDNKIGTTNKGIGYAYEELSHRQSAFRVQDLLDLHDGLNLEHIKQIVENLLVRHNPLRTKLGLEHLNEEIILDELSSYAKQIVPYIGDVSCALEEHYKRGERILWEGGQGVLLDVTHGTFPYVTSSHTTASAAFVGSGFCPEKFESLGVIKAYITRVGNGPFPSKMPEKLGLELGDKGGEFGVTTKRRRDCGWFDLVALKHGIRTGAIKELIITKLDVMDDLENVRVAKAYKINGKTYTKSLPANLSSLKPEQIEVIYDELPGWGKSAGITDMAKLPLALKSYIDYIEKEAGIPVAMFSTGPERSNLIIRSDKYKGLV